MSQTPPPASPTTVDEPSTQAQATLLPKRVSLPSKKPVLNKQTPLGHRPLYRAISRDPKVAPASMAVLVLACLGLMLSQFAYWQLPAQWPWLGGHTVGLSWVLWVGITAVLGWRLALLAWVVGTIALLAGVPWLASGAGLASFKQPEVMLWLALPLPTYGLGRLMRVVLRRGYQGVNWCIACCVLGVAALVLWHSAIGVGLLTLAAYSKTWTLPWVQMAWWQLAGRAWWVELGLTSVVLSQTRLIRLVLMPLLYALPKPRLRRLPT
jgi:hypothetical protein